jgi:DNA-directed RNA polymerase subunit RPC12/RpoP
MVVKVIRCPSCGEVLELTDMYEGMEIQCELCGLVMIVKDDELLALDTNEVYSIESLAFEEEEEEDRDEFEDEDYYDYEYDYDYED